MIDYIYYSATSTDQITGYVTTIQAQYYIPFLDFFLTFLVLTFSVVIVYFVDYLCYPKKENINIKNLNIPKN